MVGVFDRRVAVWETTACWKGLRPSVEIGLSKPFLRESGKIRRNKICYQDGLACRASSSLWIIGYAIHGQFLQISN
jgi:hypothetical protein